MYLKRRTLIIFFTTLSISAVIFIAAECYPSASKTVKPFVWVIAVVLVIGLIWSASAECKKPQDHEERI